MNFDTKQSTRIHGSYSIVSVFQSNLSYTENKDAHSRAMAALLEVGFTVTQLRGVYKGEIEFSIRIEGGKHASMALSLAQAFNQESYINVSEGKAVLRRGRDRSILETWEHISFGPPVEGDHSALMNGTTFKFF